MDKNKYLVIGSILGAVGLTGIPVATTYIKDVSQEGLKNTAGHEGYRSKPYRDPGGVITQGNGSTIKPDGTKIKMTDKPISQKEALRYLQAHITKHREPFNNSLKNVKISQVEYDLYADFVYQFGLPAWLRSDMLTNLKKGQYVQACQSLSNWRFSRVPPHSTKVDCRINSKCKGVWNRQKWRIDRCMGVNT
ncbi:glycoside hydrolase family protein [Acinetobacter sp. B10A]|uniref:glycoside hydrolase family protein n=1 Tax=Acinetobacter baretiae TaxID=2605383 RepID=UPI001B3C63B7|nr:glycoside hydrolase family protein [Acinetobacter baretiae]MBF7684501.1 glycoside hydrolase family protein [Acinetobacter baretiae]